METAMFIIISITSVFGLTYMFNLLWLWFSRPKKEHKEIVLIPLNSLSISAEEILRYRITLMNSKGLRNSKIIVIDMGMTEENKKICSVYEKTYDFIKVMLPDQFSVYIDENY